MQANINRMDRQLQQQVVSNESFSYSWVVNLRPSFQYAYVEGSLRASLDASYEASSSYIEIDPRRLMSFKRTSSSSSSSSFNDNILEAAPDFNFTTDLLAPPSCNYNSSQPPPPPPALVQADQIFSNGLILPVHFLQPRPQLLVRCLHNQSDTAAAAPAVRDLQFRRLPPPPPPAINYSLLQRWRRCTQRIVRKYLGFLLRLPCRTPMFMGTAGRRMTTTPQGAGKLPDVEVEQHTSTTTSLGCVQHCSCIATPRTISSTTTSTSAFSAVPHLSHHHNLLFDQADLETSINEAVLHCKKSIIEKKSIDPKDPKD